MKVRCITGDWNADLTKGKIYPVEFIEGDYYGVIDDSGDLFAYHRMKFEIVKENDNMKELTLQEVMNYKGGTKFKMGFDNWKEEQYIEVELNSGDLWYKRDNTISDVYALRDILEAKFYLLEQWQEIDYYAAYTTTNSNIKFVGDEEIVGTHYYILSKLNSDCIKKNKNLNEVLSNGKWFIKVV